MNTAKKIENIDMVADHEKGILELLIKLNVSRGLFRGPLEEGGESIGFLRGSLIEGDNKIVAEMKILLEGSSEELRKRVAELNIPGLDLEI